MKIKPYTTLLFAYILSLGVSQSAIAQKYYSVDEGAFLTLSHPGDLKLSTTFPGEGLYSVQLGYSPIKHLSVSGTYLHDVSKRQVWEVNGPFEASSRGSGFQLAAGAYYFLKSKKPSYKQIYLSENVTMKEGFLFDLYAGYGITDMKNQYFSTSKSTFDIHKYYVQAGVHWIFRIGSISYGLRAVRLDYLNGVASGPLEDQDLRDLFQGGIQDNSPFSFLESSFRYQIGIRQIRIYTSIITKYAKENQRPLHQKRTIITAGLVFDLDDIFGKKDVITPSTSD